VLSGGNTGELCAEVGTLTGESDLALNGLPQLGQIDLKGSSKFILEFEFMIK